MVDIIIELEVAWEKETDSKYCECGYSGHWNILKSPKGYPEINGGHYSPDFPDTEESLRKEFQERYGDKGNIIVKFHISKDERDIKPNSLDVFF